MLSGSSSGNRVVARHKPSPSGLCCHSDAGRGARDASLDGLVGDGYIHTFEGTFDFKVSYGDLGSIAFTVGKVEKGGFHFQ